MASASKKIEEFLNHCSNNLELRKDLTRLNDEQIVSLAGSQGFSFTLEELQEALDPDSTSKELDEKDLEQVAGGARPMQAVSDGLICNTIRSLFTGESGCGKISRSTLQIKRISK